MRSGVRWGESLHFGGWLPDNTHMLPVRCVLYQQQKCCFGLPSLPACLSHMLCSVCIGGGSGQHVVGSGMCVCDHLSI